MLKYQLSKQVFDNDRVNINYNSVELTEYANDPKNLMWVTLLCENVNSINPGDVLNITSDFVYFNDLTRENCSISDNKLIPISTVDINSGTLSFIDYKHKTLSINNIKAVLDYTYLPFQENTIIPNGSEYYYFSSLDYTYTKKTAYNDILVSEDNDLYFYIDNSVNPKITWVFEFNGTHYFNVDEDASLRIEFDVNNSIEIDNLYYIDFQTLGWVYYDETVNPIVDNTEDAGAVSEILFGNLTENKDADISRIKIKREQIIWDDSNNQDMPTITYNQYKVRLDIPISLKTKTDLYKEGNINEYFIQHEEEKAINVPIEMEKYMYTPVIVKEIVNNNLVFEDCTKINFNLHFRVHDGNDWTVNDSDSWNFDKYGYNNTSSGNKYYSYAQTINPNSDQDKWKRSCQSDLLTYAGFSTNDVKYQKNKLKKSFIRLSFYDSDDPGKQNLLSYSTIFVDCNKLYSKFISRMNFNCYFNSDGDIVKGIKVDREVNTLLSPNSLIELLGVRSLKPEEIEEYRLSSQISVKNKFTSNNSSEGFYLYTWELNDNPVVPADVYMKVEFNHAGYGRNIPMMAPYITKTEHDDENSPYQDKIGFKTNADIVSDWNSNRQYGIKRYTRYSYIHFKVKYDVNTKRHIYYLDPDTYGTYYGWDKNILNINLYEARITFD